MRLSRYGITLESLASDHLEMVRLWRNQEFVRCNMQFKEILSRKDQEQWFTNLDQNRNLYWVIRAHGYPIGLIHVKNISSNGSEGEAGIFVGEPSYLEMPQPMLAIFFMMELAFSALNMNLLRAKIKSGNQRAISFNRKLGYEPETQCAEEFQYYSVSQQRFSVATNKLRNQTAKMYGFETLVDSVGNKSQLEQRLLSGLENASAHFNLRRF